jgi:dephospho-CoA kinase
MSDASPKRPFAIGLTGSIGMGKSETLKLFARLGFPIYDADTVVHQLYDKGGAAVEPIAKIFPEAVREGRVDRARLSARVARDEDAFQRLETIVHPLVRKAETAFLAHAAKASHAIVVLDIPLLFETGAQNRVDAVVVVSAPSDIQRKRVLARAGMTLEKLEAIHARQVTDAEKRAQADFVIETDKGLEHAFAQVERVAASLRERFLPKAKP